jgi:hypothetical protein
MYTHRIVGEVLLLAGQTLFILLGLKCAESEASLFSTRNVLVWWLELFDILVQIDRSRNQRVEAETTVDEELLYILPEISRNARPEPWEGAPK